MNHDYIHNAAAAAAAENSERCHVGQDENEEVHMVHILP